MRAAIAWIVGIGTILSVGLGLAFLGESIGISTSIELDGPTTITNGSGRYSYDEEVG